MGWEVEKKGGMVPPLTRMLTAHNPTVWGLQNLQTGKVNIPLGALFGKPSKT